ncbi:MAG: cupin domain-containing protein [Candidatus Pacebacteria bacterium]|nr:cupin domain-containing protein [Candidatus Paceibacterota bacterium]
MEKHIVNLDEIEPKPFSAPIPDHLKEKYEGVKLGFIAPLIGAQKLGYNLTIVPPGKRAFQFHNHRVNEELFFILAGEGEVRIGNETFKIRAGDLIAHPPGGPETAHQIVNTSNTELKYLSFSTKEGPEICDYPDSKKFAILHVEGTNPDGSPKQFRYVGKEDESLGYFDGEK